MSNKFESLERVLKTMPKEAIVSYLKLCKIRPDDLLKKQTSELINDTPVVPAEPSPTIEPDEGLINNIPTETSVEPPKEPIFTKVFEPKTPQSSKATRYGMGPRKGVQTTRAKHTLSSYSGQHGEHVLYQEPKGEGFEKENEWDKEKYDEFDDNDVANSDLAYQTPADLSEFKDDLRKLESLTSTVELLFREVLSSQVRQYQKSLPDELLSLADLSRQESRIKVFNDIFAYTAEINRIMDTLATFIKDINDHLKHFVNAANVEELDSLVPRINKIFSSLQAISDHWRDSQLVWVAAANSDNPYDVNKTIELASQLHNTFNFKVKFKSFRDSLNIATFDDPNNFHFTTSIAFDQALSKIIFIDWDKDFWTFFADIKQKDFPHDYVFFLPDPESQSKITHFSLDREKNAYTGESVVESSDNNYFSFIINSKIDPSDLVISDIHSIGDPVAVHPGDKGSRNSLMVGVPKPVVKFDETKWVEKDGIWSNVIRVAAGGEDRGDGIYDGTDRWEDCFKSYGWQRDASTIDYLSILLTFSLNRKSTPGSGTIGINVKFRLKPKEESVKEPAPDSLFNTLLDLKSRTINLSNKFQAMSERMLALHEVEKKRYQNPERVAQIAKKEINTLNDITEHIDDYRMYFQTLFSFIRYINESLTNKTNDSHKTILDDIGREFDTIGNSIVEFSNNWLNIQKLWADAFAAGNNHHTLRTSIAAGIQFHNDLTLGQDFTHAYTELGLTYNKQPFVFTTSDLFNSAVTNIIATNMIHPNFWGLFLTEEMTKERNVAKILDKVELRPGADKTGKDDENRYWGSLTPDLSKKPIVQFSILTPTIKGVKIDSTKIDYIGSDGKREAELDVTQLKGIEPVVTRPTGWMKQDNHLVRVLQIEFGGGNITWKDIYSKLSGLKKFGIKLEVKMVSGEGEKTLVSYIMFAPVKVADTVIEKTAPEDLDIPNDHGFYDVRSSVWNPELSIKNRELLNKTMDELYGISMPKEQLFKITNDNVVSTILKMKKSFDTADGES